jgi:RNA polymerase sigma factor (sigma-70 family)
MVNEQLSHPQDLPGLLDSPTLRADLSDGQLLERFVDQHDEDAFASLVRRHGPMVLGVCQRVLRHVQDAEDAFQAAFLVLVRKAPTLERPELLANWLYGVAYRTAQNARGRATRRGQHEREAVLMGAATNDPEPFGQELRQLLDEELHRLPEKFRAPLVLCYLEGKTNEEAARILGWPIGSMSFRLTRGRQMLRDRLTGRLQALSVALPSALLTGHLEPPSVSPLLAEATVQAALGLLGTKTLTAGLISSSVSDLMEATLRSLTATRRQWLLGILLAVVTLLGLSAAAYTASGGGSLEDAHWLFPQSSTPSTGAKGGCAAHQSN